MSAVSMVTLKGQDEKVAPGTFTILQILYTPSILHLTLTHHNPLAIKALLCVRYYQFHLHTTCTQPARNLHNPHPATRHKHGRVTSQHRGAEKSVAPTDFSTSLCRKIHRIRQNRLRDSGG